MTTDYAVIIPARFCVTYRIRGTLRCAWFDTREQAISFAAQTHLAKVQEIQ